MAFHLTKISEFTFHELQVNQRHGVLGVKVSRNVALSISSNPGFKAVKEKGKDVLYFPIDVAGTRCIFYDRCSAFDQ